mgnify:CR=1 FL=1
MDEIAVTLRLPRPLHDAAQDLSRDRGICLTKLLREALSREVRRAAQATGITDAPSETGDPEVPQIAVLDSLTADFDAARS